MENSNALAIGELVLTVTGLLGFGSVLIAVGRLIQKVDTVQKEVTALKEEVDTLQTDIKEQWRSKDEWRAAVQEKLNKISERLTVVETKTS